MACDLAQSKIKLFLDDLLDEEDYLFMHDHLEICRTCREYAASVGTLSYRVYELGQVYMPPDMLSAICYENKKRGKLPVEDRAGKFMNLFSFPKAHYFWACSFLLLVFSIASIAYVGCRRKDSPESRVVISVVSPSGSYHDFVPNEHDGHYHLSFSRRDELLGLVQKLSLRVQREAANSLMVEVPKEKLDAFTAHLLDMAVGAGEFYKLDSAKVAGENAIISIYFEQ